MRESSRTWQALIERGAHGDCLSTVPSHSWCAWPSFMTGLNPAGHGVFDILEHKPGATQTAAGHLPVDQGAHDLRRPLGGRQDDARPEHPAHVPDPRHQGEGDRRRRAAGQPLLHATRRAAAGARREGSLPDQRDELDDVPQPARSRSSKSAPRSPRSGRRRSSICSTRPTGISPRSCTSRPTASSTA